MELRYIRPLILVVILASALGLASPVFAPYRDYQYLMMDFMALANSFPGLMTYETIGKTVLNKDIIMFKIGNPNGGRVLFDGGMHGTETIGGELLYLYAEWLLTSNDPLANRILNGDYTLLIPALNVDRYNRDRVNANGVDLNRNFATNWERSGSSDPNSDTYHGTGPLSEPESQNIINVLHNYAPSFYVNLHMWAGPYYAGSTYGNKAYYSSLVNKISSLSKSRGVTPYPYYGEFGGAGFAISDAARAGATSFLIELTTQVIPFSEIETTALPRFIPLATVLSQECEKASSVLFDDGFESQDFSAWTDVVTTAGDSATVAGTNPYYGLFSARFQTEAIASGTRRAYVSESIEETPVIYARGYFYIAAGFPLNDNDDRFTFIQFLGSSGNIISNLQVRRVQGEDRFTLLAFTGKMQTTTQVYPGNNTWYCLELYTKIHATEGEVKAYVDGVELLSLTNMNTTAFGNILAIRFGLASTINVQHRTTVYVDNAVVSTGYIGPLKSKPAWDVNQDGVVDIIDVVIVTLAYGSTPQSPKWDPRADIDKNGVVDIVDMATISAHYGEQYM